jgi:predicted PurR-regulated permease PerM
VPWRTIFAVVGVVLGTAAAAKLAIELHRVITWLLIAGFVAVVLNPSVDFLEHRARMRRGLATLLVFLVGLALFAAMLYAFIRPVVDQAQRFANDFPSFVEDAKQGRGTVGKLVTRYKLDDWIDRNQDQLKKAAQNVGKIALQNAGRAAGFAVGMVTVLVLAFLMLVEAPQMLQAGLNALAPGRRERVRRVANDAARAVTGYMFGNLLISVIAGVATYVFLLIVGVPFKEVLALWVAFADLIPLVGATLGAVVVIFVALLHSVPAGIATVIFFVVYQQFENHVLQVSVMSRTVKLNPLLVLVAVLVGVEVFGFLGALLAIPAAGVIQVVARDLWDERAGRPKAVPTVGADERPVEELPKAVGDAD